MMNNMQKIVDDLLLLYDESKKIFDQKFNIMYHKTANDVLSEADMALNKFFCEKIKEKYADACMITEENDNADMTDDLTFVVDPLDGTCNYSLGLKLCGIQIAVFKNKECIISLIGLPYQNEVYYAIKGKGAFFNGQNIVIDNTIKACDGILQLSDFYQINSDIAYDDQYAIVKALHPDFLKTRLFGAACIDFTNIAKSGAQAYICHYYHIWDIAPGLLLVKEAGAVYSGVNKPYSYGDHTLIVANNEETLKLILNTANKIISN